MEAMPAVPPPKVLVPKVEYEGLLASQKLHQERKEELDEKKDLVEEENAAIRRDLGEAVEDKPCCASPGSSSSPDSDKEEEEEEDTAPLLPGEDMLQTILPCKKKKQAAVFMRRLATNPEAKVVKGQIWLKNKLLGNIPTVLQHFYGQERLSARQAKLAKSLRIPYRPLKTSPSQPSRKKPLGSPAPSKEDRTRFFPTLGRLNPDFAAALDKYSLNK